MRVFFSELTQRDLLSLSLFILFNRKIDRLGDDVLLL